MCKRPHWTSSHMEMNERIDICAIWVRTYVYMHICTYIRISYYWMYGNFSRFDCTRFFCSIYSISVKPCRLNVLCAVWIDLIYMYFSYIIRPYIFYCLPFEGNNNTNKKRLKFKFQVTEKQQQNTACAFVWGNYSLFLVTREGGKLKSA